MLKKLHNLFPEHTQVLLQVMLGSPLLHWMKLLKPEGQGQHDLRGYLNGLNCISIEQLYGREDGCLSPVHGQGKKVAMMEEDAGHFVWNAKLPAPDVGNVFSLKAAALQHKCL